MHPAAPAVRTSWAAWATCDAAGFSRCSRARGGSSSCEASPIARPRADAALLVGLRSAGHDLGGQLSKRFLAAAQLFQL